MPYLKKNIECNRTTIMSNTFDDDDSSSRLVQSSLILDFLESPHELNTVFSLTIQKKSRIQSD